MSSGLLQRSPLRVELCRPRPSAEVVHRSVASVHSTCAVRAELVSKSPDPVTSGSVPRRVPCAAAVAGVSDERLTASDVVQGDDESLTGSDTFQRLGLDHRITVRCPPCIPSQATRLCIKMPHRVP